MCRLMEVCPKKYEFSEPLRNVLKLLGLIFSISIEQNQTFLDTQNIRKVTPITTYYKPEIQCYHVLSCVCENACNRSPAVRGFLGMITVSTHMAVVQFSMNNIHLHTQTNMNAHMHVCGHICMQTHNKLYVTVGLAVKRRLH